MLAKAANDLLLYGSSGATQGFGRVEQVGRMAAETVHYPNNANQLLVGSF